jgi:biotin operon repressor
MGKNKSMILDVLEPSRYGMSINNIAENLNWHRNTVSKYLSILKDEGKVIDRKIGQYKLWISGEADRIELSEETSILLNAYISLLRNLQVLHSGVIEGKELGKLISKDLDFEKLLPIDLKDIKLDLNSIAIYIMDILNNIYFLTHETYNFDPPIVNQSPPFIILRIRESKYIETPLHFQIITGIFEEKINKLFHLNVDISIHEIFIEESIIDIKISLKQK